MYLLNPGPVTLSAGVREALVGADLCHREPEFTELQADVRRRLRAVYGLDDGWAAVVLSGSGTAAVEAMLGTLPGAHARLLIVANGVYGERMSRMAAIHGIAYATLQLDWGAPIDADVLAAQLGDFSATHVAVVQHETTTGRLNDLDTLGAVCAAHGAALLVDAVSSFGAEAIDFSRLPIAAVAATANKCLHGAPGAAFVIARRDALAAARPRSLYLDLAAYCDAQDAGSTPFTPAIPAFYALAKALAEHADAGGWSGRRDRYRRLARAAAGGLAALGVRPLLAGPDTSCVLRAFQLPDGVDYARLHDALKARGLVIYAGQGRLSESIFRVSVMGAIDDSVIETLVSGVAYALSQAPTERIRAVR